MTGKGISISGTVCITRKQVKTGYYDEMGCAMSAVLSLLRIGVFCIECCLLTRDHFDWFLAHVLAISCCDRKC